MFLRAREVDAVEAPAKRLNPFCFGWSFRQAIQRLALCSSLMEIA